MEIQKCFHARILQKRGCVRCVTCASCLIFNRLFRGYSCKSGSKPSAFHGPQPKPGSVSVRGFWGWLPCCAEFRECGKWCGSEEPVRTGVQTSTNHDFSQPPVAPVALFCGLSWQTFAVAVSKDTLLQKSCQLSC